MDEKIVLKNAVLKAGEVIYRMSNQACSSKQKKNDSPVTEADIEANRILKKILLDSFPQYGWLSEESYDDHARLNKKRVWIVDPLDGTKEFINAIPEYVVSVALVDDGIPILGAIFNPITDEFFYASKGEGAWLNEKKITCDYPLGENLAILASRSEILAGNWQQYQAYFDVKPMGSIAYKLALVAAGQANASFSLEPRSEWDIAAGVLLMQEAGGVVHDLQENSFIFNQKNIRVNGIIACTKKNYSGLMKKLKLESEPMASL